MDVAMLFYICASIKKFPTFNSENYLIFKTKCKHFIGIVMSFHTNCEYQLPDFHYKVFIQKLEYQLCALQMLSTQFQMKLSQAVENVLKSLCFQELDQSKEYFPSNYNKTALQLDSMNLGQTVLNAYKCVYCVIKHTIHSF